MSTNQSTPSVVPNTREVSLQHKTTQAEQKHERRQAEIRSATDNKAESTSKGEPIPLVL